ncbi:hypothetical protein HAX54_045871, partial [Datura stramonium]|nr:hypothetical protein [Datura stramonium]
MGEIIVDQFKQKAKKKATTFSFPNQASMLCMRAACTLFRPLDRIVQANSLITLATKINKEALVMKRAKYTGYMPPPSPSPSTHIIAAPLHTVNSHNSPAPDLLNIAQR